MNSVYIIIHVHVINPELSGMDIERKHCEVEYVDRNIFLTPLNGVTCVNTGNIYDKTKLTHGKFEGQFGVHKVIVLYVLTPQVT